MAAGVARLQGVEASLAGAGALAEAGNSTRAALRAAIADTGELEPLRVIAGSDEPAHIAGLAEAEREYLAAQLARRGDGKRLWRLICSLTTVGLTPGDLGLPWPLASDPGNSRLAVRRGGELTVLNAGPGASRVTDPGDMGQAVGLLGRPSGWRPSPPARPRRGPAPGRPARTRVRAH